jgi:hypothetical protein
MTSNEWEGLLTPTELRKRANECENNPHGAANGCDWAATEIERLRTALETIANIAEPEIARIARRVLQNEIL